MDYNYIFDTTVDLNASTASTSFPVTNLRNFHRSKVWRTTSASAQSLVIDLKTIDPVDSFVMVFDPEENPTVILNEADIRLQANATNVWSAPAVDIDLSGSIDENFAVLSHFFSSSQNYRYWRLYIDNPTNQLGFLEISKIYLGKATILTQPPSIGVRIREGEDGAKAYTAYGQLYADTYPSRRSMSLEYKALTEADKNLVRDIYRRVGQVKPVFTTVDNGETIFSEKEEYVFYGYIADSYAQTQVFINYFDLGFTIEEAL
jgi:hypothetical protein